MEYTTGEEKTLKLSYDDFLGNKALVSGGESALISETEFVLLPSDYDGVEMSRVVNELKSSWAEHPGTLQLKYQQYSSATSAANILLEVHHSPEGTEWVSSLELWSTGVQPTEVVRAWETWQPAVTHGSWQRAGTGGQQDRPGWQRKPDSPSEPEWQRAEPRREQRDPGDDPEGS